MQTLSAVQMLNFPASKTGQTSKTPFPFHEFSVVSEQTVLGCVFSDANSPSDTPQSPFMIDQWSLFRSQDFMGAHIQMKINIQNNAHCCFPGIAFSATS